MYKNRSAQERGDPRIIPPLRNRPSVKKNAVYILGWRRNFYTRFRDKRNLGEIHREFREILTLGFREISVTFRLYDK